MSDPYRSSRWKSFREELIELDGAACVKCGRTQAAGAILQVHHKKYLPGKAPWEYPLELCETLCRRCHAAEHGEIPPVGGWEFVGEEDLGGLYGTCDLCHAELRHVFYIQHPDWPPMAVGTVCCDELTGTKEASERRKFDDRLARFKKSNRWGVMLGRHRIMQKGVEILIHPVEGGGYRIQMNKTKGRTVYPDLDSAKKRVFEFIESGEADSYFKGKA
jgi:hypothetical protein